MKQNHSDQSLKGMIISDTAIRQPVFITMLMLLAIVAGLLAYFSLPVDLMPDMRTSVVSVRVIYPGASPNSVSEQVVRPLENALVTINGVDTITSNAAQNVAVVVVSFADGVSADIALQNVREKVAAIRGQLPTAINDPVFQRIDPTQTPILTLAITTEGQNGRDLRALVEDEIVPRIQRAEGVGAVDVSGGMVRQINVNLDMARLQAWRVLPSQVSTALAAAGTDIGLGETMVGERSYSMRTPSVYSSPQDIAAVGIGTSGITVGDVADIEDGVAEVETFTRINGVDAIIVDIRKQSGTNTVAVADAAQAQIKESFAAFPGLKYQIIRDDAAIVRENVDGALEEILFAVAGAVLVVWLFFRDLRNTLISVVGLPIIIVANFAMLGLFGISINLISMLAISVAVGLVIDDAIVVRENIFRHMERGESPWVATSKATAQVAGSVLAMTLTVVAVFVPTALTSGTTGIVFRSFGVTVATSMVLSLIEAFTLAPMLSAHFFKQQPARPQHIKPGEEHLPDEAHEELNRFERLYERMLAWTLRHRLLVFFGVGGTVLALSVFAAGGVKSSFLPSQERQLFGISYEATPGTPLSETDRRAREIEQIISADPAVKTVLTSVGGTGASEQASFLVQLHPDQLTPPTQARLRMALAGYTGLYFSVPSVQTGPTASVSNRPLQLRVRGTGSATTDDLAPVAAEVVAALQGVPGMADLATTYSPGKPELRYSLDQKRANDYGLTNRDLALTMRVLVDGDSAAVYRESGQDYNIVVRLRPEDRTSVTELRNISLPLGMSSVPLGSVTTISEGSSPATIRRVDRQPEILIGANNVGRNINEVRADMTARLKTVQLPPNVTVSFGGATSDQMKSFSSLMIAAGLSILFVYMILASQFGSFLDPLVILLAMPLSFVGAFLGLRLTGLEMDMVAMIGLIMLLGLVVKNSILLVDFTNRLRRAGMTTRAALERAGAVRLRPILMTSAAIVLGSLPAAIGLGMGAELRRSLATVVIGGVITSTLLTLVLVPIAYSLLDSIVAGARRLTDFRPRGGKPRAGGPPADETPMAGPPIAGPTAAISPVTVPVRVTRTDG